LKRTGKLASSLRGNSPRSIIAIDILACPEARAIVSEAMPWIPVEFAKHDAEIYRKQGVI